MSEYQTLPQAVTIFGSGQTKESSPDYLGALETARLIALEGYTVCNGGYSGVMEASARGAREAGGRVIGITTMEFASGVNPWITDERRVTSWKERLFGLIAHGEAYVFFDGGTGTLTELFVVWEMINKGFLQKPLVIFGPFLRALIETLRQNPSVFLNSWIFFADSPRGIVEILKQHLGEPAPHRQ